MWWAILLAHLLYGWLGISILAPFAWTEEVATWRRRHCCPKVARCQMTRASRCARDREASNPKSTTQAPHTSLRGLAGAPGRRCQRGHRGWRWQPAPGQLPQGRPLHSQGSPVWLLQGASGAAQAPAWNENGSYGLSSPKIGRGSQVWRSSQANLRLGSNARCIYNAPTEHPFLHHLPTQRGCPASLSCWPSARPHLPSPAPPATPWRSVPTCSPPRPGCAACECPCA